MKNKKILTQFAPAKRATEKTLQRQVNLVQKIPLLDKLYNAVTEIVLILNKERQIVYFNQSLVDFLKVKNPSFLYGLRPGEALQCVHARGYANGGCGTSKFCSACGAAKAIFISQNKKTATEECRIIRKNQNEALDLLVHATPWEQDKEIFTIFTLKDIGDEKRRKHLEQIFFHDVLNTASCIQMASELLHNKTPRDLKEITKTLSREVAKLIEEINDQKILAAAENHELLTHTITLSTNHILEQLYDQYLPLAEAKKIKLILNKKQEALIHTDWSILLRVLANMTKNALEASSSEETVTLGVDIRDKRIDFYVHNPEFIPEQVQLQIFQRSFSTKGTGRGLGTYSMKLLSEKYLKGKVTFISSREKGTIFTASYPKK